MRCFWPVTTRLPVPASGTWTQLERTPLPPFQPHSPKTLTMSQATQNPEVSNPEPHRCIKPVQWPASSALPSQSE